jgi:radical SAM superfamily enzyme YgiQ (UPF0313 family)
VSISPERWRDVGDTLVIGEAERTWPRAVEDFFCGRLQREYREDERPDLRLTPVPDYSGFSRQARERFFGGIVQTSRGCPYDCEFCDVIVYVGRKMRYKPISTIMAEVTQLHREGLKAVVLADDNFSGSRSRAKEILRALRDWNGRQRQPLSFITQLSIDAARDEELLALAAEAGLNRVCVGIESVNPASLAEAHKTPNLRSNLAEDLRAFHRHGILILGTTIVGFDSDDCSAFHELHRFLMDVGVVSPQVFPLQAPDGTPLKQRMVAEGRYLDWHTGAGAEQINVFNTATMVPKQMTVEELQRGCYWLMWQLYQLDQVRQRLERFFDDFDASPVGCGLQIPKSHLDLEAASVVGRLVKRLSGRGQSAERRALVQMMARAGRSKHPQCFTIAIATFLAALNVRETLLTLNPDVASLPAP